MVTKNIENASLPFNLQKVIDLETTFHHQITILFNTWRGTVVQEISDNLRDVYSLYITEKSIYLKGIHRVIQALNLIFSNIVKTVYENSVLAYTQFI